jgi:hypothetical protein
MLARAEFEAAWRGGYANGQRALVCHPLGAPGSQAPMQGTGLTEPPSPPWTRDRWE